MGNLTSTVRGVATSLGLLLSGMTFATEKQHVKMTDNVYAAPSLQVLRDQVVDTLPVRITVTTPNSVTMKHPVIFGGTLKNLTRTPTQFILGSLMRADFAVYDSSDQLVWGCYFNAVVTSIAIPFTLKPLEKRNYSCRWNLKDNNGVTVKPGLYSVEAFFSTDNPNAMFSYKSERRAFRVQ